MTDLKLETNRLILRPIRFDDLDSFYHLMQDEDLNRFLPWFIPENIEDAMALMKHLFMDLKRETEYPDLRYGVFHKATAELIGYVRLQHEAPFDFGYGFKKLFWNQGIATEAAQAVLEVARRYYPYVSATHDILNPASGRVMQKLGFNVAYSYREWWLPKEQEVIFSYYQLNFNQMIPLNRKYLDDYPECGPEEIALALKAQIKE